ncbi:STAS/SEC14 domain-containing protein [Nitrospina watsonii]|uniref:STAS/SEC14 domain-containing protein n=1 Tax=Nitrospina watsonii TaxID=1323948 RepID=A0ABM9HHI1_9BACT|nr:STAS/SEC14 domain-containing protein [Nitrospina watsonii]CAI2719508.1 conserved protein of unknown function [Nitrospina watsonii]
MIELEKLGDGRIGITLPRRIEVGDFPRITPEIDALIADRGRLKVLLNIAAVRGWSGVAALREHVIFVRAHHRSFQRMAVVVGPAWQRLAVRGMRLILFPRVKVFDSGELDAAQQWLQETAAPA